MQGLCKCYGTPLAAHRKTYVNLAFTLKSPNIHEKYEILRYCNIFRYLLIVVVVKYSLVTNPRWRKPETEMVQKRQFISTSYAAYHDKTCQKVREQYPRSILVNVTRMLRGSRACRVCT